MCFRFARQFLWDRDHWIYMGNVWFTWWFWPLAHMFPYVHTQTVTGPFAHPGMFIKKEHITFNPPTSFVVFLPTNHSPLQKIQLKLNVSPVACLFGARERWAYRWRTSGAGLVAALSFSSEEFVYLRWSKRWLQALYTAEEKRKEKDFPFRQPCNINRAARGSAGPFY